MAAAAYRSGDCLLDERQGLEHDYTRRSGVVYSELVLPDGAGEWTRSEIWNAAEEAEKRKDGRTAREWEIALPDELNNEERRELAVSFAEDLAERYGCAVDVAVHAPDRGGDQRNWHAHLLATTRKVTPDGLGEKCEIELSDAKRLSMDLPPARKEIETVREVWADHVNERLELAGQQDRVDHRSLATQYAEAAERNEPEKAAELDREPQVKLGWKVVQMERRGESSDRGDQLREVHSGNGERRASVISIDEIRNQLAERKEAEQRDAVEKEAIRNVEEQFRGKSRMQQENLQSKWQFIANWKVPQMEDFRAQWEQSSGWNETRAALISHTQAVDRTSEAVDKWHQEHRVQSFLVERGLRNPPVELQAKQDEYLKSLYHQENSQKWLAALEQRWTTEQPEYERKIESEAQVIQEARGKLKVIDDHPEHFKQVFEREHQAWRDKQPKQERQPERKPEPQRGHDRGRDHERDDGWSR